jgi:site-specific DNA recombinase
MRTHARQSKERLLFSSSHHFKDEGYSGSTLDRPEMQRLRKVIDLGGIDRVYAVALDRLSRNMHDTVVHLKEFEKAGVELRLVHQPDLNSAPDNRFLHQMLRSLPSLNAR